MLTPSKTRRICCAAALSVPALPCLAQDIELCRWSHLPLDCNFAGVAYGYTQGDFFLNPVLRIEDGEFEMHTAAFKYIHAFELLGKSACVDLAQFYQSGSWSGLLNGESAATERDGFVLIAWLAEHGKTGVMTLIVNHDGDIYEKDFGLETSKIAAEIKEFNLDSGWLITEY